MSKSNFSVVSYSLLDKDENWSHWSKGLNIIIEKDGVTLTLNSEEIQQLVKTLPRTFGGKY